MVVLCTNYLVFFKNVGFKAPFKRLYNPHHLQHFNNKSLITLLETKGLQIIKKENHNYELKAVDVPSENPIIKTIYLLLVSIIFFNFISL